jgi:hypothetical protein
MCRADHACQNEAVALAPQTHYYGFDGSLIAEDWIPICAVAAQTWWENRGWMGTFAWLSHGLPAD